jgi:hypothetical protein
MSAAADYLADYLRGARCARRLPAPYPHGLPAEVEDFVRRHGVERAGSALLSRAAENRGSGDQPTTTFSLPTSRGRAAAPYPVKRRIRAGALGVVT